MSLRLRCHFGSKSPRSWPLYLLPSWPSSKTRSCWHSVRIRLTESPRSPTSRVALQRISLEPRRSALTSSLSTTERRLPVWWARRSTIPSPCMPHLFPFQVITFSAVPELQSKTSWKVHDMVRAACFESSGSDANVTDVLPYVVDWARPWNFLRVLHCIRCDS